MSVTTPIPALGFTGPLSNVAPFTYRDNFTYLETLMALIKKINEIINGYDGVIAGQAALESAMLELTTNVDVRINAIASEVKTQMDALRDEVISLIEDSVASGVAIDPTTGIAAPLTTVISRLFDNVRVHAYFAKQLDEQNLTALEIDNLNRSARHFDLSPVSPTNDEL